jgi:hypothetical protein
LVSASSAADDGLRVALGAQALRACRSAAARTAELSTFSTSIGSARSSGLNLLTPITVCARVDARLRAGGGLLDAQLRDAGLDGLRHAAERLDLLDVRPGRAARSCGQRST